VETINPMNIKKSEATFQEALQFDGVAVVISKYPCMLIKSREKGDRRVIIEVLEDQCTNCETCLEELTCPAMYTSETGKTKIDTTLCRQCNVCIQICPERAIRGKIMEEDD
jgi:indolepyruvate ferredoxin oxidoreductase alpha subunit